MILFDLILFTAELISCLLLIDKVVPILLRGMGTFGGLQDLLTYPLLTVSYGNTSSTTYI
jgi:hypothetical protein